VRNRSIRHLPLLPGFNGYGDHYLFLGVLEQSGGDLIAAVGGAAGQGLWKYSAGRWTRLFANLGLPEVFSMLEDANGTLYLAFTKDLGKDLGIVGKIRNGYLESLPIAITPFGFAQTSYGVLAYGARGIAIDRGGSFHTLPFLHPERARLISGMVESGGGDLWINGARGIVRIPAAEVRAAIADPAHAVSSVELREGDFVGPDIFSFCRNSAHIDPSGRLWFSTLNGVVSVDPTHLSGPHRPPQLSIREIIADGHPLGANGIFPPDIQYLDIKYFGLDLSNPNDVVYRYRLQGLDTSWQDVEGRTEAIYTHIRPGTYRFQVMASNGNDIWTEPASSAVFRILPHYYQRAWVQALFILVCLILLWIGISLRVRDISHAIKMGAEERADERIRISRDLHDTLLQGVQGLLLSFHVAAEKVPADHESKPTLEKALTMADYVIVEARNRVNRLRSENLTDAELKSLIESVAANLSGVAAIEFALERSGGSDVLHRHVVDEVFCIAREALTNAYRHSGASRIVVELDYQKREFRMTCRDNGRGFNPKEFVASQTDGHWGVRGMAERAENMGASFSCDSPVNGGTEVRVVVPARRAYQRQGRFQFFGRRTAV
jgi:signal transduction histidine kinase